MAFDKPNIRMLNILYGFSLAVSFIYLISTFVVATKDCVLKSGCSDMYNLFGVFPGEAFSAVFIGFFWISIFSTGLYWMNKDMTQFTLGCYIASSANVVVTALCSASWSNSKVNSILDAAESLSDSSVGQIIDSQFVPAMRSMLVASALIVILQVLFLVLMTWWKDAFAAAESGDPLYADTIGRNINAYQDPMDNDDTHHMDQVYADMEYNSGPTYQGRDMN